MRTWNVAIVLALAVPGCIPVEIPVGSRPSFSPAARTPAPALALPEKPITTVAKAEGPPAPNLEGLLCGVARHRELMRFWPRGEGLGRIRDRGVIVYTDVEMPRLYQVTDEGLPQVVRADQNTSANNEFPWDRPAGVPAGSNVTTFRFAWFPGPVEWWRGLTATGTFDRYRWRFPNGTLFGELLCVEDAGGNSHAFEVRTRGKNDRGQWRMQVYRPFPTEEDLRIALEQRRYSLPRQAVSARSVASADPQTGRLHGRNGFRASGNFSDVWPMGPDLVKDLLDTTPFEPALNALWDAE